MESRNETIRNYRALGRKKAKQIWIERFKAFFITCFFLSLILFILFSVVY